jgi:3,4-dihydroxy 2-butanone 4-phosphate synthase / GTP cyclohydrolase II
VTVIESCAPAAHRTSKAVDIAPLPHHAIRGAGAPGRPVGTAPAHPSRSGPSAARATDAALDGKLSRAHDALAAGRPVLVVDRPDGVGEATLVLAAENATATTMAILVRHGSGYVTVALPSQDCERLQLPAASRTVDAVDTAGLRVSVDAAQGVSTGISARDRARTARLLANPTTLPSDLTRPGHVVPRAVRDGGSLESPDRPEAAVDLLRAAALRPVAVLCDLVSERHSGQMARDDELAEFAETHAIPVIAASEVALQRRRNEPQVERAATTHLPTDAGPLLAVAYRGLRDGAEHLALLTGLPADPTYPGALPWQSLGPVHVHVECLRADVFGARDCGCAQRLEFALTQVARDRRGVVLYLRPPGRSALSCPTSDSDAAWRGQTGGDSEDEADGDVALLAEHVLRDLGRTPALAPTVRPPRQVA